MISTVIFDEKVLVIEDSPAGTGAAVATGMMVVAAPTRLTGPSFRDADLVDRCWTVEDPEELEEVIHRRRIEDAGGRDEPGPRRRGRGGRPCLSARVGTPRETCTSRTPA